MLINKPFTWEQLVKLISQMSEKDKKKFVKISKNNGGGLRKAKYMEIMQMTPPHESIPYIG